MDELEPFRVSSFSKVKTIVREGQTIVNKGQF